MKRKHGELFERQVNFDCLQQIRCSRPKQKNVEDYAISAKMASQWLRLVMIKYFPVRLIGGCNQRRLIKLMKILFTKPNYALIRRDSLLQGFKTLPWTQNSEVTVKFGNWFIDLMLKMLCNTFYITDNSVNVTQFYHKWDWRMLTQKKMADLATKKKVNEVVKSPEEVVTNVRFLPAKNKLRMLMPFKSQIKQFMKVLNALTLRTNRELRMMNSPSHGVTRK